MRDLQLWPGQFVNVKLLVDTLKQVIVIPSAAVQRGPNGTFVYVANDDNTVCGPPRHGGPAGRHRGGDRVRHRAGRSGGDDRLCATHRRQPHRDRRSRKTWIGPPAASAAAAPRKRRPVAERASAGARRTRQPAAGAAGFVRADRCARLPRRPPRRSTPAPAASQSRSEAARSARHDRRPARPRDPVREEPSIGRGSLQRRPQPVDSGRPQRHERIGAVHPSADRDVAARRRRDAGRHSWLCAAAGRVAATGRFPDHPGDDPAPRRQCRDDRVAGHGAARTSVRPDPGALDA